MKELFDKKGDIRGGVTPTRKKLLAIGIPTYGRADRAINLIKNALNVDVYDQIIVSSNSYENELDLFISSINTEKITFFQQKKNVGLSLNYAKVIRLCECKYLHMVGDEDSINKNNISQLYSVLNTSSYSVIFLSLMGFNNALYRDVSQRNNTKLRNVFGDAGHFGSSIINVDIWNKFTYRVMQEYCSDKGAAYPTVVASILSYSQEENLLYFPYHIVEMGVLSKISQVSGYNTYGFQARLDQLISLLNLMSKVKFKEKYIVYLHLMRFFFSHAFIDATNKWNERCAYITKESLKNTRINNKTRFFIYLTLLAFYPYRALYSFRLFIGKLFRLLRLK